MNKQTNDWSKNENFPIPIAQKGVSIEEQEIGDDLIIGGSRISLPWTFSSKE